MSSNYPDNETNTNLDFNNLNITKKFYPLYSKSLHLDIKDNNYNSQNYNRINEVFTDLQSCLTTHDTDSGENLKSNVFIYVFCCRIFIFKFI